MEASDALARVQRPLSPPASLPVARVCLLGNSALDRLAYRLMLTEQLGYPVIVDSNFTPAAVWMALRGKPEIVLLNADSATGEAIDAARMTSRLLPAAKILVLGASVDPLQIHGWSRCTIHGYVVKDAGVAELAAALRTLGKGAQYYSDGIRDLVRRRVRNASQLTRREAELLPLLARGMSLREAASKMAISYKTADSYRTMLMRKLGMHDRVELARYAIRERIIEP